MYFRDAVETGSPFLWMTLELGADAIYRVSKSGICFYDIYVQILSYRYVFLESYLHTIPLLNKLSNHYSTQVSNCYI